MTDPNRHLRTGSLAPWPAGKLRNPPSQEWLALKRKLIKLMRDPSVCNYGKLGASIGAARGTVRRWFLPRTDRRASNPSPQFVRAMAEWEKSI